MAFFRVNSVTPFPGPTSTAFLRLLSRIPESPFFAGSSKTRFPASEISYMCLALVGETMDKIPAPALRAARAASLAAPVISLPPTMTTCPLEYL